MSVPTSRRNFVKTGVVAAGTAAVYHRNVHARILGANDRINLGFIGVGGRGRSLLRDFSLALQTHPAQIVAVCDTYRKRLGQAEQRLIEAKQPKPEFSTLDYREVIARKDIDAVVIATPDHWHAPIAIEAMKAGKDVYCEKPMTRTVEEAKKFYEASKATNRVVQIGSQTTSSDQWWKARKAIADGMIGQLLMSQGSYHRNSIEGEWNYTIDPNAGPSGKGDDYIDWKMWLGNAPARPFSAERFFRFRKYWDYSGGIATDLFYHALAPYVMITGQQFPDRVTASGGIYVQKDREVPDTLLMNVDYSTFTVNLSCSVASGASPLLAVNGTEGRIIVAQKGEDFSHKTIEIVPDHEYRKEFKAKTGEDKLLIECQPNLRGMHLHMDNFMDCVRSRKEPNLGAELGYKVMAAIRMGVDAYRQQTTIKWDARRERAMAKA